MSWSKIKAAINSTLGTTNFKPLDKIVVDSFQKVVSFYNELKNSLSTGENNFIVESSRESEHAYEADVAKKTVFVTKPYDASFNYNQAESGIYVVIFSYTETGTRLTSVINHLANSHYDERGTAAVAPDGDIVYAMITTDGMITTYDGASIRSVTVINTTKG